MSRCFVCGRFMSDDDILLGIGRIRDGEPDDYAHYDCAKDKVEEELSAGTIIQFAAGPK